MGLGGLAGAQAGGLGGLGGLAGLSGLGGLATGLVGGLEQQRLETLIQDAVRKVKLKGLLF